MSLPGAPQAIARLGSSSWSGWLVVLSTTPSRHSSEASRGWKTGPFGASPVLAWRASAPTPAANGVAIEVPDNVLNPVVLAPAEGMLTPGAAMSGLIRPSAVGPRLENAVVLNPPWSGSAIAPTVVAN